MYLQKLLLVIIRSVNEFVFVQLRALDVIKQKPGKRREWPPVAKESRTEMSLAFAYEQN